MSNDAEELINPFFSQISASPYTAAKNSGIKLISIPELTNEHSLSLKDLKALLKIYLIIKKYKPPY